MEGVGAGEPVGTDVLRPQPERGAALRDERPLAAARLHEDADPAGPRARDPDGPHLDAVAAEGRHEGAARRVAPDRADQRAPGAEPAQPARGRRRRAALPHQHAAGDVGAPLQLAVRREHDVHDEVAQHHDRGAGRGRATAARRDQSAGCRDGGHRPSLAAGVPCGSDGYAGCHDAPAPRLRRSSRRGRVADRLGRPRGGPARRSPRVIARPGRVPPDGADTNPRLRPAPGGHAGTGRVGRPGDHRRARRLPRASPGPSGRQPGGPPSSGRGSAVAPAGRVRRVRC